MNDRIWLNIFLVVVAVFLLSACQMVRGSGDMVTETREISNFDNVALRGSGEVVIVQSGEESLVIETDDNILQYITSEVSGGTLILGFEPVTSNISPTELIFTVGVDDLVGASVDGSGDISARSLETDSLDVDIGGSGNIKIDNLTAEELAIVIGGSGNIKIDNLTAEELAIVIDGSGDVQLVGEVEQQSIDIGGSGEYSAGNLRSDSATVTIGGSADAIVWAMKTLDVDISGSGSVDYYGSPRISSSQPGSGSLNSMGEKEG